MTEREKSLNMVRKVEVGLCSTESSSSDKEEELKLPSEVLKLGSRIVHELELDQRTSTLSRWMAHHLAEIIEAAEKGGRP